MTIRNSGKHVIGDQLAGSNASLNNYYCKRDNRNQVAKQGSFKV